MDSLSSRLPRPSNKISARVMQPRVPLTKDLTNLTNIVQGLIIIYFLIHFLFQFLKFNFFLLTAPRRCPSPDMDSRKTDVRANFRRSRSALDIRSHLMAQPQLKTTSTNNLQTTKSNPMRRSRSVCDLKLQSGSLLKRAAPSTSTNNLHATKNNPMRRSISACDLKMPSRTMLKRAAPQTTTIPAKLKKINAPSSSISTTSSRLIGTRPKLAVNKTATTTAVIKTQVKIKT